MIISVRTEDCRKYGMQKACIISYLREFPEVRRSEMAYDLGVTNTAIGFHIRDLAMDGVIEKVYGPSGKREIAIKLKK